MPKLRNRYENVKVWRPDGTLYAEGQCEFPATKGMHAACGYAVADAFYAFKEEFTRYPERGQVVIEITVGLSRINATLYELPLP